MAGTLALSGCLYDVSPSQRRANAGNAPSNGTAAPSQRTADPGNAVAGAPASPQTFELELGGVKLGETEAAVRAKLGPPALRREGEINDVTLDYDGLSVWLDVAGDESTAPGVAQITSTSAAYCTAEGVCPGMPLTRAEQAYGPAERTERENGTFYEFYPPVGSEAAGCWFRTKVSTGTLTEIALVCQP